jgi:hypothetical protein
LDIFKRLRNIKPRQRVIRKCLKIWKKKEERYERSNSLEGNITVEFNPEKSPKKNTLSKTSRFRHLIPKKLKTKNSTPLPFIYDRLNK